MRYFIIFISLIYASFCYSNEGELNGTWQGVMIRAGQSIDEGTLLYTEFNIVDGLLSGYMRDELYESEFFSVKKVNGKFSDNTLDFKQLVIEKSKKTSKQKWCRMTGKLTYDSETGYLKGKYESYDCRRVIGEIILYKSDFDLVKTEDMSLSHIWFDKFINDYSEGLSAPLIRKKERDNFVFEPVYFDFDKFIIRNEHYAFLDRLIKVVKGHSDLRVKVTGHTDSDGSDNYNITLSKNRAQAIIEYFKKNGLNKDRLVFDFKGENSPVAPNNTSEGKQRNRRVDFSFI